MIKLGDTLYRLNRYPRQDDDRWTPVVVVGETARSWLYAPWGEQNDTRVRIDKKTLQCAKDFRGMRDRYFTLEGRDAWEFCHKHARNIASAVSVCDDPAKLVVIAKIVGKDIVQ